MRKIREVLRLKYELDLPEREIARHCQLARRTVGDYLRRFQLAQLRWPLPAELDDARLEAQLFPPPPAVPRAARPAPVWAALHQELRQPGVTLFLLWQEYKVALYAFRTVRQRFPELEDRVSYLALARR